MVLYEKYYKKSRSGMIYQMNLLFKKPQSSKSKRQKKLRENAKRKKEMHDKVLELDNYKCRDFMTMNHNNPTDNILECCHLLPRDINRPELDEPWNVITLRRFVHRWIDGREKNPLGLTARQYKLRLLYLLKKVNQNFRHQRVIDIEEKKESQLTIDYIKLKKL